MVLFLAQYFVIEIGCHSYDVNKHYRITMIHWNLLTLILEM